METLKLAVFISGRGSNMQALMRACAQADFPARITVVLSNRSEAAGLTIAAQAGIATEIVDHKNYPDKASFEAAVLKTLEKYDVGLICLAGFMRILSAGFIEEWPGKIINIHPSLLPAYKGLDTHARVIADGATESGCSVHFVTPGMDEGPVILQKKVAVLPADTPDSLAARILEQEHAAYPEAVALIARGLVRMVDGRVEIR